LEHEDHQGCFIVSNNYSKYNSNSWLRDFHEEKWDT
jgi:hypothetical protein